MNQRNQGEKALSIVLDYYPVNPGRMRRWVREHSRDYTDKIGESTLFTFLIVVRQCIDSQHRRIARQRSVDQSAIGRQFRGEFSETAKLSGGRQKERMSDVDGRGAPQIGARSGRRTALPSRPLRPAHPTPRRAVGTYDCWCA